MKTLQIFKPGKHTDVKGIVIDFTEDMLRACAAAYDPAKHEAPLVIGHPVKMEDPAYGWAKAVSYADGALVIDPDQVEPQFAEMVNAGRFKKISPSFYLPDSPNNPTPGQLYLRHIGFLGAAAPAVKGLKSASFADSEQGVVEFSDVAPWRTRSLATILRGIREMIISKFSIEEADRAVPDYLITDVESVPEASAIGAAYSEQPTETSMLTKEQEAAAAKLKSDQADLARREAEFAERESAVKASEEKTRREGIAAFVTALVKAGKILPRDEAGLVAYMAGPDETGVIEFGEGDDKKSVAPDAFLRAFLDGLPKQVDYQEHSAAEDLDVQTVSFAAPPGYSVDPARLEIHNKALAHQAKHKTTYEAALAAVQ